MKENEILVRTSLINHKPTANTVSERRSRAVTASTQKDGKSKDSKGFTPLHTAVAYGYISH